MPKPKRRTILLWIVLVGDRVEGEETQSVRHEGVRENQSGRQRECEAWRATVRVREAVRHRTRMRDTECEARRSERQSGRQRDAE